jgi:hypothetical protein
MSEIGRKRHAGMSASDLLTPTIRSQTAHFFKTGHRDFQYQLLKGETGQ